MSDTDLPRLYPRMCKSQIQNSERMQIPFMKLNPLLYSIKSGIDYFRTLVRKLPPTFYMIKFFRRIRQKLLSENKFSKYLLYALVEIVLVVIGILIALQINNWNEEQKRRIEE